MAIGTGGFVPEALRPDLSNLIKHSDTQNESISEKLEKNIHDNIVIT